MANEKPILEGYRKPVYETGDGIERLKAEVGNPVTLGDDALVEKLKALDAAFKAFWEHLDANYKWD